MCFFLRNSPHLSCISEILLAAAAAACYKPCGNMKMRLFVPVLLAALPVAPLAAQNLPPVAPVPVEPEADAAEPETEEELEAAEAAAAAAEEELEQADTQLSPAAVSALETIRCRMDALADMLAAVVDAPTAAAQAPQIAAAYEALRQVDFSALAEEDEEFVAAEFAEDIFIRLDDELARLADADYFGNEMLAALFGSSSGDEESPRPAPAPAPVKVEIDAPVPEADTESPTPDNPIPIHKRP